MAANKTRVQVYRANDGWRWRFKKGRILANGGQGYSRRIDCIHALQTVTHTVWVAERSALVVVGSVVNDRAVTIPVEVIR